MGLSLLTIGHSVLPWEDFLALLKAHGVGILADVRLMPVSRRHPQFKREHMQAALREAGITYAHFPELGGMRKPRPDSPNAGWKNGHFRGYADYMETEEFQRGVERLNTLLPQGPMAVMCAEAVPWRCHRSLLADAETARGIEVAHILDAKPPRPHVLTAFAEIDASRQPPLPRYPGKTARRKAAPRKAGSRAEEAQTRLL